MQSRPPYNYTHLLKPKQVGPFKPDAQTVTPPEVKVQRIPYMGPNPQPAAVGFGFGFVHGGNQRGRILQEGEA